jgi:hypothetical protein
MRLSSQGLPMDNLTTQTADWLQSILQSLPARIHAVYVEYGDVYTPEMVHLVCFNAFGFESLAGGSFDPVNTDHLGELGEFTWEPSEEYSFKADDYPLQDWMAVLRSAAEFHAVKELAQARRIQFIVGEHDSTVYVVA